MVDYVRPPAQPWPLQSLPSKVTPITAEFLTGLDTIAADLGATGGRVATIERRQPTAYNVRDYGAVGDGLSHPLSERYANLAAAQVVYPHATALTNEIDWAAFQGALKAARIQGVRRGGTVHVPLGRYVIHAPLLFTVGVSIIGEGWSLDSTFYNVSAIVASAGFVGSAILKLDADGNTVSDPVLRPDLSWHWGVIEKIFVKGNAASRTVTDGVLNSTTTITSATAAFVAGDVGSTVTGVGIPSGATIASVTDATTVVLSAAAVATATAVTLKVTKWGPHGIDPGWNGEASSIRNLSISRCNSAIYLNDVQASCTLENISLFGNNIGVNCDTISTTVRMFGISGDNNTNLIRVKGGKSGNVSVFSMKAENYDTGTGDPVILIEDLLGGAFNLFGGWADTNAARNAVIKIAQPSGSNQRPRVTVMGFDHNSLYTNLINDTFDGLTVPAGYQNLGYPAIFYNVPMGVLGSGSVGIGYGRSITGTQFGGAATMPLVSSGADNGVVVHAGVGASGGRLRDSTSTNTLVQWRKNGANNLGFFGVEPVLRPTALTVADASTVDATYGAEESAVINNLRTRLGQLETKLQALGLLT